MGDEPCSLQSCLMAGSMGKLAVWGSRSGCRQRGREAEAPSTHLVACPLSSLVDGPTTAIFSLVL